MDLTGQIYGERLVLEEAERRGRQRYWLCRCSCGSVKEVSHGSLRRGSTGCKDCVAKRLSKLKATYGQNKPFGRLVGSVFTRCDNPDNPYYGGLGINIWPAWRKDKARMRTDLHDLWFKQTGTRSLEMYGPGSDQLSLDRIDNNGNYEPGTLEFTDKITQANNRRAKV